MELVRARFGQGADNPSGKASVLGGDASREGRDLLDRVLDEEVIGLAPQVLADHDTVHEEKVVVGGSPGDGDLVVDSIGVDAGHDHDRPPDRPGNRELVELRARQVGCYLGRLEDGCGDGLAAHRDVFLDLADTQIGVGAARFREQQPHLPGDRLEALELEHDRVFPGRKTREVIDAVCPRHLGPRPLELGRGHGHGDPG